jgi:PPOX class probable F420-dependent enzyme
MPSSKARARDDGGVKLNDEQCWAKLASAHHAVLATLHADRGVDPVPVVFALSGGHVLIPIDRVKAKAGPPGRSLQRQRNLDRDPRCSLLVDHYDNDDWSQLWWVRLHATGTYREPAGEERRAFADRYPQYRSRGAISAVIVLVATSITGWRAKAGTAGKGPAPQQ